jgi:hypothetical protein
MIALTASRSNVMAILVNDVKEDPEMKSFTILATFPTLPAPVAQQAATAQASRAPVAVGRALEQIMRRDGVKGRQIESFTLRVTCNGKVEREG